MTKYHFETKRSTSLRYIYFFATCAFAEFASATFDPACSKLPRPTAMDPMACAVPLARKAPPAPAVIAGMAGMEPTVMRTAEMAVMALGCSTVRNSSA